jgi:hypothetical protein
MANDIPSSQMLHPTSHKEENTNYRKLRNDGTYSINCTPIPILRSRTVRRPHINKAISKANKVLGFPRRNIGKCPQDIKEKAYLTLVRPHLEYSSAVWDPYRKQHINSIKMVQRRAARIATSTYSQEPGTVTNILNTLGWPSLQSKRKTSRLTLLYNATHDKAAINIPSYIRRPSISTRQNYPDKFSQISTSTDAYKFSFLPRTITTDLSQVTNKLYHKNCIKYTS